MSCLFETYRFCGRYFGDYMRREQHNQYRDNKNSYVESRYPHYINRYGYKVCIVILGVEWNYVQKVLAYDNKQTYDIAPQHSAYDEKHCIYYKYFTYLSIAHTQSFEYSYRLCAFEYDDKQPRNHIEPRHSHHQNEYDVSIGVEHVEPVENLWVQLFYCLGVVEQLVFVEAVAYESLNIVCSLIETVEVF